MDCQLHTLDWSMIITIDYQPLGNKFDFNDWLLQEINVLYISIFTVTD